MGLNKDNNNRQQTLRLQGRSRSLTTPYFFTEKKINVFDCSCYIEEYYSKFMEEQMCHLISLSIGYAKYD